MTRYVHPENAAIDKPTISVVIATFNSARILPKVLDSVVQQRYPRENIEILIVDGGSTDSTKNIAAKYGCKVINNPRTEPVFAKFLGYMQAAGKFLMYLDHDEVIENPDSFNLKTGVASGNSNIRAVVGSGYKNPENYPIINNYLNEFGDPFSFFMYRLSKSADYFVPHMKSRYPCEREDDNSITFNFSDSQELPLIELCAAGSMVDAKWMKERFPETTTTPTLIAHFFYLMVSQSPLLAVTKNDALVHYSSETLPKYLNKIRWRVKNNIHHVEAVGVAGFEGRSRYLSPRMKYKKFLFIPYAFTLSLVDAFYLAMSRRKALFLIHYILCVYTACLILYHYSLKLIGKKPILKSYDEKKNIVS